MINPTKVSYIKFYNHWIVNLEFKVTEKDINNKKIQLILPNYDDNIDEIIDFNYSFIHYDSESGYYNSNSLFMNNYFCKKNGKKIKYKNNNTFIPILSYKSYHDNFLIRICLHVFWNFCTEMNTLEFYTRENVFLKLTHNVNVCNNYYVTYHYETDIYINNQCRKYFLFHLEEYGKTKIDICQISAIENNFYKLTNKYSFINLKIKEMTDNFCIILEICNDFELENDIMREIYDIIHYEIVNNIMRVRDAVFICKEN